MTGPKRTPEQIISDLQKKIKEQQDKIEARKAKAVLKADHESIKPIIDAIKAAAKANGVEVKAIVKTISEKLIVKKTRAKKAQPGA